MSEAWKVQNSPAWYAFRSGRIGASDAATIAGLNPWKSPLMLYEEKVNGMEFSISPAAEKAMQRGHKLEPVARELYQDMMGYYVFPDVTVHPRYNWLMASLDGWSEDNRRAAEFKCPGDKQFKAFQSKGCPIYYKCQMTVQMFVWRIKRVDFFAYNEHLGTYYEPYHYEFAFANQIMRAVGKFYRCMINKTPPVEEYPF